MRSDNPPDNENGKTGKGTWLDLAPGITYRLLRLDEQSGQFTIMIRAAAGSRLPRHRHEAAAEIYIVKGNGFHPQTGPFSQGDYVFEQKNAIHDAVDFNEDVELFMVNYGPSSFLGPDDSVQYVMDAAMMKARAAQ